MYGSSKCLQSTRTFLKSMSLLAVAMPTPAAFMSEVTAARLVRPPPESAKFYIAERNAFALFVCFGHSSVIL